MKTKFFSFLVFSLITTGLFAQKGTLRGKIIDAENGETLIGAAVAIEGTTTGTITDFDGNYSIELDPGTYNVTYSFISYEKKKITQVEIKDGEVTIVDVNLGQADLQLDEIVVSAKANKSTETAVMVMQRKSGQIMDGISAQQISRLGDSNAAAALKRVTGVSVQSGKYVFVRGLGDRYTKTTLNNAEIPALDPEKNTVQMDIFPSNIIENIVVKKSFSPEMPGESTGGQVDIRTKDFPEKLTLHLSTSWEYNTLASMNDEFISYDGGKYDWLGLDGGQRAIPGQAQQMIDNMSSRDAEQISIASGYSYSELNNFSTAFDTRVFPKAESSFLNHSYKFALGNQTKLFNKALGFNLALSYSNSFDYYGDGNANLYSDAIPSAIKTLTDRVGSKDIKLTALANLNYKLSNNHKVGIRMLRNQSGSQTARYRYGILNYESSETETQERSLSYLDRNFTSGQIHGKHVIPGWNNTTITWLSSYTMMTQDEPDTRFFINLYEQELGYKFKTNNLPLRLYRDMEELNFDNKLDIEIPTKLFGQKAKIKLGGAYLFKDRDAGQNKVELTQLGNTIYNGAHNLEGNLTTFLTENVISDTNPLGFYYTIDPQNDKIQSYQAKSRVTSGYGMLDFHIGENLRMITGARFEYTYISVANMLAPNESDYSEGEIDQTNLLPTLALTFTPIDNMNLRIGASQTISRPVFREISPQSFFDYKLGMSFTGNPDLEACMVTNVDFRWEYFFDRSEMVALSGFYKAFDKPIETRLDPATQNFEVLYFNSENATIYGLEAELRANLDFIDLLQHFSLGGNLTLVKSSVDLTEQEQQDRDEETRPMVGQAPYVVNAYLGYDNPEIKLNANLGFNISGKKLFLITQRATPYVYESPMPSLNFNISKGFGERFNVEFSVNNILNPDYEAYYDYDEKLYNLRYSEGITFGLSVKYLID